MYRGTHLHHDKTPQTTQPNQLKKLPLSNDIICRRKLVVCSMQPHVTSALKVGCRLCHLSAAAALGSGSMRLSAIHVVSVDVIADAALTSH